MVVCVSIQELAASGLFDRVIALWELTRFRGHLTRPNLGAEVAYGIQ
jgi:hypothetical protein